MYKKDEIFWSTEEEPHKSRMREILKAHPEVAKLIGRNPYTALVLVGIVTLQLGIAFWMGQLGFSGYWWLALILAYAIGAFANHSLYVIIHEATHNLIFKNQTLNKWAAILADMANTVPGSLAFRIYHIKHHAFMGDYGFDADLPSEWEAKVVGNSTIKKTIWMFLFPVMQIFRTAHVTKVNMWNTWMFINMFVVFAFDIVLIYFVGFNAVFYLFFSMLFGLGLHPVGARWIQEHYTTDGSQETFSYYGPLNALALNVGYHNEHHDFPSIPWNRLPKLKKMAPEFYDSIDSHKSWTKLMINFLIKPEYSLYSRIHRASSDGKKIQQAQPASA